MTEAINQIALLQNANGSINKMRMLREFKDNENFRNFLYYALNPMITYKVSEITLRNIIPGAWQPNGFNNIFEICDLLSKRKAVDEATVQRVCSFLRVQPDEHREVYIKLLAKTLRLGVTAKTVNKIIDGLIPEWEVQQAYPFDKYPVKDGDYFWLTEKLNGVRATFYKGVLYARSGTPFEGLEHILADIENSPMSSYVLDGELVLKDKSDLSDNEAFRITTGLLNSENVDKTAICYTVFDIIPIDDFDSETPSVKYSARRSLLDIFANLIDADGSIRVLPVLYKGTDQSLIEELLSTMIDEDKEGLMLNTDAPYKRTRHKGVLKIKKFYTMDLEIIGCEEGTGRLEGTLGALVLEYKGNIVFVGSGFTDEQRAEIWNNRDSVIGSLCEVKYKEISENKKTGMKSLQFPVFVRIRQDKSDISYG